MTVCYALPRSYLPSTKLRVGRKAGNLAGSRRCLMDRIDLAGTLRKEGDLWVAVIDVWNLASWGETVEEAVKLSHEAIDEYLTMADERGCLEEVLSKALAAGQPPISLAARRHRKHRVNFGLVSDADDDLVRSAG
jgi:predicted RNase H-like HicB family nuclease